MDPAFGDVIASKIYKSCFKHVYGKNMKVHSEKDEGKFEQCMNSYVESYKTVTGAFINYIGSLPKKGMSLSG